MAFETLPDGYQPLDFDHEPVAWSFHKATEQSELSSPRKSRAHCGGIAVRTNAIGLRVRP